MNKLVAITKPVFFEAGSGPVVMLVHYRVSDAHNGAV
jgi:hypothetical protein